MMKKPNIFNRITRLVVFKSSKKKSSKKKKEKLCAASITSTYYLRSILQNICRLNAVNCSGSQLMAEWIWLLASRLSMHEASRNKKENL